MIRKRNISLHYPRPEFSGVPGFIGIVMGQSLLEIFGNAHILLPWSAYTSQNIHVGHTHIIGGFEKKFPATSGRRVSCHLM